MYYVGLDIHQRSTSVEILDCNGKLVKRAEWKLSWPQLAELPFGSDHEPDGTSRRQRTDDLSRAECSSRDRGARPGRKSR